MEERNTLSAWEEDSVRSQLDGIARNKMNGIARSKTKSRKLNVNPIKSVPLQLSCFFKPLSSP